EGHELDDILGIEMWQVTARMPALMVHSSTLATSDKTRHWSGALPAKILRSRSHALAIVRRFAHDLDVVDVALAQARAGDAQELAVLLHVLDGAVAGVAHGRAQAAD